MLFWYIRESEKDETVFQVKVFFSQGPMCLGSSRKIMLPLEITWTFFTLCCCHWFLPLCYFGYRLLPSYAYGAIKKEHLWFISILIILVSCRLPLVLDSNISLFLLLAKVAFLLLLISFRYMKEVFAGCWTPTCHIYYWIVFKIIVV